MLAPLTGNHPQSVFQSVSLLFNYPFKPYNLGVYDAACGERHTGKIGARDTEEEGGEGRPGVGVERGIARRSTGFISASVRRYRYTTRPPR